MRARRSSYSVAGNDSSLTQSPPRRTLFLAFCECGSALKDVIATRNRAAPLRGASRLPVVATVCRNEQVFDLDRGLDDRLIRKIAHERFERRPIGFDAIGPG